MKRAQRKHESHRRIVEAASRRLREGGLEAAGVQRVMSEAGLTHGGFYSHFASKDELLVEALTAAMDEARERLMTSLGGDTGQERLGELVRRYLSRSHRDAADAGCPIPAVCAEMAHAPRSLRDSFDAALGETIERIAEGLDHESEPEEAHGQAIGTLAVCLGGLLLARAAGDRALSDDILQSCRHYANRATRGGEQK